MVIACSMLCRMHLRDACVDLSGRIVAAGRMRYPNDDKKAFPLPDHDSICFSVRNERSLSLAPVTAVRDSETGFFVEPSRLYPSVHLPASIAAALQGTLRAYEPTALRLRLPGQDGMLSIITDAWKTQPLSDWSLEIDVDRGSVAVRLSAGLQMLKVPTWKNEANYWTSGVRIEIEFVVDAITRTALFEVPLEGSEEGQDTLPLALPQGKTRLEAATIDQLGRLYAFSRSGAVRLGSVGRGTLIIEHGPSKRLFNGFVVGARNVFFPRIWLYGIDLETLIAAINERTASIVWAGGNWSHVDHELRGEPPYQRITQSKISAEINDAGLTVAYYLSLTPPSEAGQLDKIEDSFTLPWASLILRFPWTSLLGQRRMLENKTT